MYKILLIYCCFLVIFVIVFCDSKSFKNIFSDSEKNYGHNSDLSYSDKNENSYVRSKRGGRVPNIFPIFNYLNKNVSDFKLHIKPDLDIKNSNELLTISQDNYKSKSIQENVHYQDSYEANDASEIRGGIKEKKEEYDTVAQMKSRAMHDVQTGRKKKKQTSLFERVFPMFIIPYLVQSAILPMLLMSLKFMLMKSFFIGKMALFLLVLNAFRRRNEGNDNMTNLAVQHYGYTGGEEYGAYVHK